MAQSLQAGAEKDEMGTGDGLGASLNKPYRLTGEARVPSPGRERDRVRDQVSPEETRPSAHVESLPHSEAKHPSPQFSPARERG